MLRRKDSHSLVFGFHNGKTGKGILVVDIDDGLPR